MRISDWSSDVCSSDLTTAAASHIARQPLTQRVIPNWHLPVGRGSRCHVNINEIREAIVNWLESVELRATRSQSSINCHKDLPCCENVRVNQIGRASCRERVCQYV